MSNKRNVCIATPTYDGKVVCDYSVAIAEIFRIAGERGDVDIYLRYWMYEALIQKSRNNLFTDAYNQGFDDIVFIDADQSFSADMFFRVLEHPVDVVGVPVRMKTDEDRYNIRPEQLNAKDFTYHADLDLLEVAAIGTGFLRLSRKAMQAIWDRSQPYNDGDQARRMICNLDIINGGIISEDIQICDKLKDAGLKIYADYKETCDHFGTKRYTGSYMDYAERNLSK